MIEVAGPDTATTCGSPTRRLQINGEYVVGIGGPCSPFRSWTELSSFSAQEIESLRDGDCGMTNPTPTISTSNTSTTTSEIMVTSSSPRYHHNNILHAPLFITLLLVNFLF